MTASPSQTPPAPANFPRLSRSRGALGCRYSRARMPRLDPQSLPQHIDRLYRAAWALCGSPHDAEDLVQETFSRVLARPRFMRGQDELAYLMQALRNTFLTQRRTAAGGRARASRRSRTSNRWTPAPVSAPRRRCRRARSSRRSPSSPRTTGWRSSRSTSPASPTARPPRRSARARRRSRPASSARASSSRRSSTADRAHPVRRHASSQRPDRAIRRQPVPQRAERDPAPRTGPQLRLEPVPRRGKLADPGGVLAGEAANDSLETSSEQRAPSARTTGEHARRWRPCARPPSLRRSMEELVSSAPRRSRAPACARAALGGRRSAGGGRGGGCRARARRRRGRHADGARGRAGGARARRPSRHRLRARVVSGTLEASVEGVSFPYWGGGAAGRRPARAPTASTAARSRRSSTRAAEGKRIGYAIVAGDPLPATTAGAGVERGGVRFRVLDSGGATVVTWREAGHTCILAARGVPAPTPAGPGQLSAHAPAGRRPGYLAAQPDVQARMPARMRYLLAMAGGCGTDQGYFPRGRSMLRAVHEEKAVGLMYGQRALCIGALKPLNYVGTSEHTRNKLTPFRRITHTAAMFEAVFFGSCAEADKVLGIGAPHARARRRRAAAGRRRALPGRDSLLGARSRADAVDGRRDRRLRDLVLRAPRAPTRRGAARSAVAGLHALRRAVPHPAGGAAGDLCGVPRLVRASSSPAEICSSPKRRATWATPRPSKSRCPGVARRPSACTTS